MKDVQPTLAQGSDTREQTGRPMPSESVDSEVKIRVDLVRRAIRRLIANSGSIYSHATFDEFETPYPGQARLRDALLDYAAQVDENIQAGRNIIVTGPAGTGKDHALVCLARRVIERSPIVKGGACYLRGEPCYAGDEVFHKQHIAYEPTWENVQLWFARLRATFGKDTEETENDLVDSLIAAPVLVLSDLARPTGVLSDFQADAIYRVVEERSSRGRPTWVSVNVATGQEADGRITPQVADRLRAGALILRCNWPSLRSPSEVVDCK